MMQCFSNFFNYPNDVIENEVNYSSCNLRKTLMGCHVVFPDKLLRNYIKYVTMSNRKLPDKVLDNHYIYIYNSFCSSYFYFY